MYTVYVVVGEGMESTTCNLKKL